MSEQDMEFIRKNAKAFADDSGICTFRVSVYVGGVQRVAFIRPATYAAVEDEEFRLHECIETLIQGMPGGADAKVIGFELVQPVKM